MGNGFMVNWNTFLAGLATLIAISGWITTWRKAAIAEGISQEAVKVVKEKQIELEKKTEFLRGCTEEANGELKSLKTDMNWVKETLMEIKELLRKP